MDVQTLIASYVEGLPEPKRQDIKTLCGLISRQHPDEKLWFLDGKDPGGKTVSNPNIGFGHCMLRYADGSSRPFYRIGLSANTTGVSVYVMGIDKSYLRENFGAIGRAAISGYCIKFRSLKDIDLAVLAEAIRYGMNA